MLRCEFCGTQPCVVCAPIQQHKQQPPEANELVDEHIHKDWWDCQALAKHMETECV